MSNQVLRTRSSSSSYFSPLCRCERPSVNRSKLPAPKTDFPACSGSARLARNGFGMLEGPPCSPSSSVPGCAAERGTSPPGKQCPLPGWGRSRRSDSALILLPMWAQKRALRPAGAEEHSLLHSPPRTPGLGSGQWSLRRLLTGMKDMCFMVGTLWCDVIICLTFLL